MFRSITQTLPRSAVAGALMLAASLGAGSASAATLGLTTGTPSLTTTGAVVDFLAFDLDGDLSTFGAVIDGTSGVSPAGAAEIGFGVGFALGDPTVGATGGFGVSDEDGFFLGGDLLAVGFMDDLIELRFGNLTGSAAASFGSEVLARIAFDASLSANPFAALVDGDALAATITIAAIVPATTPIPLPAGLPLLLGGLATMAVLRRRRT